MEVTPEQAESIAGAAVSGQLSLALRPLSDANVATTDDPAKRPRTADGPVSCTETELSRDIPNLASMLRAAGYGVD